MAPSGTSRGSGIGKPQAVADPLPDARGGVTPRRIRRRAPRGAIPSRGWRARDRGVALRQPRRAGARARRRACRARTPRRAGRGGRNGRGGRDSSRAIRATKPALEAFLSRSSPRRTQDLTVPSGCAGAARARRATAPGRRRARSPASGRLRGRSTQSRTECASAPASSISSGVGPVPPQLHFRVSSSSRVIVTVSGSRRRRWSRQRLRTIAVSHVCGFAFAARSCPRGARC